MSQGSKPTARTELATLQRHAVGLPHEVDRRKVSEAALSGQLAVQTKRGSESDPTGRVHTDGGQFWASVVIGLHDGTVTAHSAGTGHGSTFTARLPVAAPSTIAAATASLKASPGKGAAKRILIVDDNEDARVLLAEILTAIGHRVATAADGLEALKLAKELEPEIAILDLGLPVMDGFELAARLRAELATVPRLIALTGYGQKDDRERTRAAGFDAHLVKPVDMQRLLASITPPP